MEKTGGRFTRAKRVDNFLNPVGWRVSNHGSIYKIYDKHRIDFYQATYNGLSGYDVTVDREDRKFYAGQLEVVKFNVINELIDRGYYAIKKG